MNQGFFGALEQYWSLEPKARLHRRNTYFDDAMILSNWTALKMGIVVAVTMLVTAFVLGIIGMVIV